MLAFIDASRRLLNFKVQEDYFSKVVDRYERYHLHNNDFDAFNDAFASLSLDGISRDYSDRIQAIPQRKTPGNAPRISVEGSREVSEILMAMRKIREAIIASARKDPFALRAYAFIIRATIQMRHMESYHPALLHLLRHIHPAVPLTASGKREFVGYYILDLSCRQDNLATAYQMVCRYGCKDVKVRAVLKALVHGNWYGFWRLKSLMSNHQQRLMEYAEGGMRRRALDCLGKGYLSINREFLERSAQESWDELKEKVSRDWQLEADYIITRQVKRK